MPGQSLASGMEGRIVVVAMHPELIRVQQHLVPGHVYFVSTDSHEVRDYNVWMQLGPMKLPMVSSIYAGVFDTYLSVHRRGRYRDASSILGSASMHQALRRMRRSSSEIIYYCQEQDGLVHGYHHCIGMRSGEYMHYTLRDIHSLHAWHESRAYEFSGVVRLPGFRL